MVLSYWRSSAELEDLVSTFTKVTWMHCTVTLGIVVKCVHATTLPDLQASALDLQWYHGNRMLRKESINIVCHSGRATILNFHKHVSRLETSISLSFFFFFWYVSLDCMSWGWQLCKPQKFSTTQWMNLPIHTMLYQFWVVWEQDNMGGVYKSCLWGVAKVTAAWRDYCQSYSGFHMCMVQACIAIPASMHFSCEKVTGDLLSTVLSPSFERPLYSCS